MDLLSACTMHTITLHVDGHTPMMFCLVLLLPCLEAGIDTIDLELELANSSMTSGRAMARRCSTSFDEAPNTLLPFGQPPSRLMLTSPQLNNPASIPTSPLRWSRSPSKHNLRTPTTFQTILEKEIMADADGVTTPFNSNSVRARSAQATTRRVAALRKAEAVAEAAAAAAALASSPPVWHEISAQVIMDPVTQW